MLQEMPVMSSGGGGESYVQTFASVSQHQVIPLGFYPDQITAYFGGQGVYCFWNKDVQNGKVAQGYNAQFMWYSLPNTTYAGFEEIDANGNLKIAYADTNVSIFAYKA